MHGIEIILTIAISLGAAVVLGYVTHRLGLSPIVGYLLAGLAVGPFTPGFVGDTQLAADLAEVGIVLLMFGVGLQFHWKDLLTVKMIAVPGAIVQSAAATMLGIVVAWSFGWNTAAGVVLGIAISVASTVVLIRVLMDNNALQTPPGHSAVGWLVVEDLFTVVVLVLLPAVVGASQNAEVGGGAIALALFAALGKLAVLGLLMAMVGSRVIPKIMEGAAKSRSRELFTLTVLVMAMGIAAGSAWFFGASLALGAFLAGIVINRSHVGHQAISDVLPMRDAFAVLFFVSVGMLFDPRFLIERPGLVLAVLGIILLAKPVTALLIVVLLGHPVRTALTIAIGLAQIGEFSFILSAMGRSLNVLPEEGHSVLVAGALISISLNPLLFGNIGRLESLLQKHSGLWLFLTWRLKQSYWATVQDGGRKEDEKVRAVVVGYGPVGQTLTRILNDFGIKPVIIEMNVNTVKSLKDMGCRAIYGDGSRREILEAASVGEAEYLLVTLPDASAHTTIAAYAREINPDIRVLVRARYLAERTSLEKAEVHAAGYEELEIAVTLANMLLREIGLEENEIARESVRVRLELTGRNN